MEKHHLQHLETRMTELHANLKALVEQQPMPELIRFIHQPGWTTIAEETFFTGLVDTMRAHTKTLLAIKQGADEWRGEGRTGLGDRWPPAVRVRQSATRLKFPRWN